jgi:hypothetical protein
MLRRMLLPIMLLAMPALAQKSAQQPATAPLAMLASLPAGLAGFARGGTTNYAMVARDPRLGAAVDYRSPRGVTARVFLYDAGERQIGGSNTASLLEAQLRAGINEVGRLYPARHMRILAERPAKHVGLRCTLLDIGADDGPLTESAVCLGTVGGLFLKLRVTAPTAAAGALDAALSPFAKGLVALLR